MKTISAIFAAIAALFAPTIAAACPACFGASSARTIAAYYASTMLLSLMPFALIGSVILAAYLMRNRPEAQRTTHSR
jgi:hypothetical protein